MNILHKLQINVWYFCKGKFEIVESGIGVAINLQKQFFGIFDRVCTSRNFFRLGSANIECKMAKPSLQSYF